MYHSTNQQCHNIIIIITSSPGSLIFLQHMWQKIREPGDEVIIIPASLFDTVWQTSPYVWSVAIVCLSQFWLVYMYMYRKNSVRDNDLLLHQSNLTLNELESKNFKLMMTNNKLTIQLFLITQNGGGCEFEVNNIKQSASWR